MREPIKYPGTGYGVEPCSRCGGKLLPGQDRLVVPGEWRPFHLHCPACEMCGENDHRTGECLL